ncbi:MAG: DUF4097 family beta strand repeat-containing protein [Candidatus Hydrogenedentota bacterium]
MMNPLLKSLLTAATVTVMVLACSIALIAPQLRMSVVGPPAVQEKRHYTFDAIQRLRLENNDGALRVRPHEGDAVEVEARITMYTYSPEDGPMAREYRDSLLVADAANGALTLISEPDERPGELKVFVDYAIRVPFGTDLHIDNANGNVWVGRGSGQVNVQGRNADLEVFAPRGKVTARTTNGRIRVLEAPHGADLETVNGNVYAHVSGGRLRADSTNGAVVARVLDAEVEACDLTSKNGGITVVLSEPSAEVYAETGRGSVRSDLPLDPRALTQRRQMRGAIGDRETRLNLHTLNGNIWIRGKAP